MSVWLSAVPGPSHGNGEALIGADNSSSLMWIMQSLSSCLSHRISFTPESPGAVQDIGFTDSRREGGREEERESESELERQ